MYLTVYGLCLGFTSWRGQTMVRKGLMRVESLPADPIMEQSPSGLPTKSSGLE